MSQFKMPGWVLPVVILGVFFTLFMSVFFMAIGIKNEAVGLTTQFYAQEKANMATYDGVTKIIFGKAQVSKKYAEDFAKVYQGMMSARYEGKDPMMNWVQERNPELSADLYQDINRSIEAERVKFTREQKKLIDIKREHDVLRLSFPSSIFMNLFGEKELVLKIVTSSRVEKSFETGKDDNADPFTN